MSDYNIFGNISDPYIAGAVTFLVLLVAFKLFEKIILLRLKKMAKRSATDVDDVLVRIVGSLKPPFYLIVALWFSLQLVDLGSLVGSVVDVLAIVAVVYQGTHSAQILIDYVVSKKTNDKSVINATQLIGKIAKITLWVFALLLVLSNLGVNITSLVAGLGIGGIAVALAVQGILSDLFSSFSIYLDKPFRVGDVIEMDGLTGTVEKIGIKTTRLTSLQGEELVIPNNDLVSGRIHNYKKLQKRRAVFTVGVEYSTPKEKLEQIPLIIENIITGIEKTEYSRCHLKTFGDWALVFEVAYYVGSDLYDDFMDINHAIHIQIKEGLEKEGIEMAFPTQTIHIRKDA